MFDRAMVEKNESRRDPVFQMIPFLSIACRLLLWVAGKLVPAPLRGEWREGTARILTEPRAIDRAHAALRTKYGWQAWLADALSRLTGRIHRRAWIEIRL